MDEVAVVRAADRVGFKYTWATEHHFLTEYSHLSANEVFLGYLAAAPSASISARGSSTSRRR
jgi:alkanesulfonate monooxygenase SsuD/methylene tetrahydromethanopterin reductase-like flavin-dependent oxidoreductase (luciferase family)